MIIRKDRVHKKQDKYHSKMLKFANKMVSSQISQKRHVQSVDHLGHNHCMFIVSDPELAERVEELISLDFIDKIEESKKKKVIKLKVVK